MFDQDLLTLGLILLGLGVMFYALTRMSLRGIAHLRPRMTRQATSKRKPVSVEQNQNAVLLIRPGGRVVHANVIAREWLDVPEGEMPNLEHLAHRSRPRETFLSLCAAEGRARFTIQGLLVDGFSYQLPVADDHVFVLTLQRPQLTALSSSDNELASQTIEIFGELSQAMTASLDLKTTVRAILESVNQLVPSDFSEITVWDKDHQHLIPYRYVGALGVDRSLETPDERYTPHDGFTGQLISAQRPLLVADIDAYTEVRPAIDRRQFPLKSFLGIPLKIANESIGTLEIASLTTGAFSKRDLDLLVKLSEQAAVAIQNALIHAEEQRRANELSGLANLAQAVGAAGRGGPAIEPRAQAVGALRDPRDLYERLIHSIDPLLDVEILGLLTYDEGQRRLEGQVPFLGIPDQVVELYRAVIAPGSQAAKLWYAQETIVTKNAAQDERMRELGLTSLAQAAGIQTSALIPLAAGGRMLGYLQAANKRDGSAINEDDLRLLAIIAGQIGPILENATLIQESRRRTRQAEALRRIASLVSSGATLDEVLKFSIQELARLLRADLAALYLHDPEDGGLHLHQESVFGSLKEHSKDFEQLAVDDPRFRLSVTASRQPFLTKDYLTDPLVPELYLPVLQSLGEVHSLIAVPLEVRDRGIGEILLVGRQASQFTRSEVQLSGTVARQLAGAIERSSLYQETDQTLLRRIDRLATLNRISRELSSTLELESLLQVVYNESLLVAGADCGTVLIFSLEEAGSSRRHIWGYLGDPPGTELARIEQDVMDRGGVLLIEDFMKSEYQPAHPEIRSSLLVPLLHEEIEVGLLHLHGKSAAQFNPEAVALTESLAKQAATVLHHAHRFSDRMEESQNLSERVRSLDTLLTTTPLLSFDQPIDQILEAFARGIQNNTPYQAVLVSKLDPSSGRLKRVSGVGIGPEMMEDLRRQAPLWEEVEPLLAGKFQRGRSYYVPVGQSPGLSAIIGFNGAPPVVDQVSSEHWQTGDLLIIPLYGSREQPLGLIQVDAPRDNALPSAAAINELEIYARQAGMALDSYQQLQAMNEKIATLQTEHERARQATKTAQQQLPVFLHKDLEQTLTIHNLNRRAQRMRAGLDIAEIVNHQPDRSAVLWTLGQELLTRNNLDMALVAEPFEGEPRLLHALGALPDDINAQALLGQRNPLRQSLQTGEPYLIANVEEDEEWHGAPLLNAMAATGCICLPVSTDGRVDAAVLAVSGEALPPFTEEDKQIYSLLSNQVAITLQNLSLLTETRRRLREVGLLLEFSQQVGGLSPLEILQTLLNSTLKVVKAAHAGMVALWDGKQGELVPQAAVGYTDNQQILEIAYRPEEALPGQVFSAGDSRMVDEVDFASQYKLSPENLMRYREGTGGRVPVSSLLVPLRAGDVALGVLVLDNFNTQAAFRSDDRALIESLAQQTALTLENARLYQAAEERAVQLQSLTNVTATITSSLQSDELILTLLDQLAAILPFDTGTLWLRHGEHLTVRAAKGFDEPEGRIGLTVAVEDSRLLSEMIVSEDPIYVGDVRSDARFPAMVEHPYLSWLGVPLTSKGEVVGVIALEKKEANFFVSEHIQAATTFAGQSAVALENARLYEESQRRTAELDQRSRRLDRLNRISSELSQSLDPDHILSFAMDELRQAVRGTRTSGVILERNSEAVLVAESPAEMEASPLSLPSTPLFERLSQSFGVFNTDNVLEEDELRPLFPFFKARNTEGLLALPLATGNTLHGLILVHSDHARRFEPDEVELARTISNQASIAFQNARLFEQTRRLTEELEERVVERTEQLAREVQRTQTLLDIITELSASLDLDIILNRTLGLLNEIAGAEQSSIFLVRPDEDKLFHRASLGFAEPLVEGGKPTWLRQDEGLAGWVIKHQEPILVPDVLDDPRWVQREDSPTLHRSALGVPLMVGAEALGTLILFHRQVDHFSPDQLDLIQATAKQIAVAINNAQLYLLIRDQAERLGAMLRSQQVETARTRAILESVADGILVTDANGLITLFNASAEEILGLDQSAVVGKSLDEFTGLFGGAGQAWMETIQAWSKDPTSHQAGEIYSELIELEDEQVVDVSLALVVFHEEFLGTVSIFRDITHQVEVDRLKSEFVATVSHELRTPMTSIKGYVEVLLMGAPGPINEKQADFLQVIKENTERLNILVNDLLDISRIESGKVTLALQPVNLREIAERVIKEYRRRSHDENKPVSLELDLAPKLPRVIADSERLEQILMGLVDNAYSYTPEDGLITVKLNATDREVQIDIQDTGIGVAPEDQARVFDRFYRGEHPLVLANAGTGLGLSIVRHLVEMHNGRIWMSSSGIPGQGSTFSFTLPAYIAED